MKAEVPWGCIFLFFVLTRQHLYGVLREVQVCERGESGNLLRDVLQVVLGNVQARQGLQVAKLRGKVLQLVVVQPELR